MTDCKNEPNSLQQCNELNGEIHVRPTQSAVIFGYLQNVLELQVPVTDVLVVRVADGAHDLVEHMPGLVFSERAPVLRPFGQATKIIIATLTACIGWWVGLVSIGAVQKASSTQ